MDIQKQHEDFDLWWEGNAIAMMCEEGEALKIWQAAKAQAVQEGFVLVKKEPDADLVNHGHQVFLGHFNEGGQTGGRSLYFAYKAMLEAQEQSK